jgi:hypothetical protein
VLEHARKDEHAEPEKHRSREGEHASAHGRERASRVPANKLMITA